MFRKKFPIVTATLFYKIEKLRLALEVLTGKRVSIKDFDFNTCAGAVYIDGQEFEVGVATEDAERLFFGFDSNWYVAHFKNSQVKVMNETKLPTEGDPKWWVGTSFVERWEQSLYGRP